jgi:hypothetical protein
MKIIKGTESIPVEHPVFLIFGQPGICKTSLAYSAKDPLLMDFDQGAHRAVNRRDTLTINTWADVAELMDNRDALAPYGTIVIDTAGRCLDVLTADIATSDPKKAPGGNLSQQGWGVLKNRFRTWTSQMRLMGKDVLIIAHDKEDKDGDTRIVRPEIVGGSYGEVMKVADFVGYLYMSGKDRVLDFNPTDRWIGKNPAAWAPFKVPPVGKATTFMAELFDKGRAALGGISAESAKVMSVVEDWRTKIDAFTNTEECTKAVDAIAAAKLSPIVEPQVKKLLMDRVKFLQFVYSPELKAFVEKPQVEKPQPVGATA